VRLDRVPLTKSLTAQLASRDWRHREEDLALALASGHLAPGPRSDGSNLGVLGPLRSKRPVDPGDTFDAVDIRAGASAFEMEALRTGPQALSTPEVDRKKTDHHDRSCDGIGTKRKDPFVEGVELP